MSLLRGTVRAEKAKRPMYTTYLYGGFQQTELTPFTQQHLWVSCGPLCLVWSVTQPSLSLGQDQAYLCAVGIKRVQGKLRENDVLLAQQRGVCTHRLLASHGETESQGHQSWPCGWLSLPVPREQRKIHLVTRRAAVISSQLLESPV